VVKGRHHPPGALVDAPADVTTPPAPDGRNTGPAGWIHQID
jgi:hypothetical protein